MEQQDFKNIIVQYKNIALLWIKSNKIKFAMGIIILIIFLQYLTLPNSSLQSLRKNNPGTTAMMLQRIDESSSTEKKLVIQQHWIPLTRVSKHLINAVIVSEDGMFFEHEGVDWYEVGESIEKNFERGKAARGGSTISQQLSKNLYLSTSKDPIR
ncbi:MAG: transglycosylase domain-containing protein [Candidatus Paceibacterota bacterium]